MKYQGKVDPNRLVFIDETWVKTNMAPLRGWAPRGQRLRATVPHGHWKTMTFLAALRHDRVEAPWLIDGPINGDSFRLYVEQVLAPTLRPGDIVVMDNLGCHKAQPSGGHPGSRRQAVPPAKILARSEPDRDAVLQAEAWLREAAGRSLEAVCDALQASSTTSRN